MNTKVIADELVEAIRKISPAADVKVVEHPFEAQSMWFTIDAADALKLIDFINDHQKPRVKNPDQLTLF